MTQLVVGTVNFGRDDTPKHHKSNILRVHRALANFPHVLLLVQEIMEGDKYNERGMLYDIFSDYTASARHRMVPILAKGLYKHHTNVIQASPGIAHVTPARDVVDALFSLNGKQVAAVNDHPPQGAFTDPGQSFESERSDYYRRNWELMLKQVSLHTSNGVTTFFGGDMNNPRPARPFPDSQHLINHSLDHLWAVERKSMRFKEKGFQHKVDMTIDGHDMWYHILEVV